MKKIAIRLEFGDKTYLSNYDEYDDIQEKEIIDLIKEAVNGKLKHISLTNNNIEHFFNKNILEQSILSLVYDNK